MKSQASTLVSWSSGKDSAWALHLLQQSEEYKIVGLLTTLNSVFDRVAMHSTRREVLEAQAAAAGLPLQVIPLPWPCSNREYEAAMQRACDAAIASGVEAIAFGDLFLEDLRRYREDCLRCTGLTPLFPIWGLETRGLLREMIASGVKARIVCVDPKKMPGEFAGRDLDEAFLRELPAGMDPCGENGEFHTCVYDGPMSREAIPIESGEVVEREGFVFADVRLIK
ncbi:MAG TPA: hypothetical protein VKG65_02390 [Terriglobales bacterium]|nr:hypothetical protein [Terriglobales bacterium]